MNKIILFLFISLSAFANDIPFEWIGLENANTINTNRLISLSEKITNIQETHNTLLDNLGEKYPNLDRFDLSLGVNSSGSLGIFSFGKSASIEMIWRRKREERINQDQVITIEITPQMEDDEIANAMIENIKEVISFKRIKNRVRKKLVSTLYKDASKINKLTKKVLNTPQVGNWAISGFWRNYYFSSSFGLFDIFTVGYDKRIRFRFNVINDQKEDSTAGKADKTLVSLMTLFNQIQAHETNEKLEFYRVRASVAFSAGFDILVFSKSVGKGYLVEFRKNDNFVEFPTLEDTKKLSGKIVTKVTNKINQIIAKNKLIGNVMDFNQVRYNFGISGEIDLNLVSLEKERDISFHFKRRENKEITIDESNKIENTYVYQESEAKSVQKRLQLKQIDYLHRGSVSFGIPFINRIRIRPSYEYRYGLK